MVNVVVNLNVTADTSGNIEVFGQAPYIASNVVDCSGVIPARALYDGVSGKSLMEFWEPESGRGTIYATRKAEWDGSANFISGMGSVLGSQMSLLPPFAAPFDDAKYDGVPQYRQHSSFGRLALFAYAHYLFGHGAATAAITNDEAFINYMNGNGAGTANIPTELANKLRDLTDAACVDIVKSVIGQDASRAKDEDNNELAPYEKQDLKFYAGDTVYVHVKLLKPSVTVSNGAAAYQQSEPTGNELSTETTYTLKITLS